MRQFQAPPPTSALTLLQPRRGGRFQWRSATRPRRPRQRWRRAWLSAVGDLNGVADFNGDGDKTSPWPTRAQHRVDLVGRWRGHFSGASNFGAARIPASVAVGDFNGDGNQDLAVANHDSDNVSILLGDGAGIFRGATNFGVGTVPLLQ